MATVLASSRFRRLLIGQSVSNLADTALYLSLGIWAKDLTGSNSAAGAVFLALTVPVLFAPAAGSIVDRVRRRPLLVLTNLLTGLVVLSLLLVRGTDQLWILYTVAVLYGCSALFIVAARSAMLKELVSDEDLASANAALQTASQGIRVLSPLIGAALYAAFGGTALALFVAALFVVAAAILGSIRVTETEPEPRVPFRRDVLAGFQHIRSVPLLLRVTLAAAAAWAVLGFFETVIFAVIETGLHRSPSFFGVITSIQGVGAVLSGLTAGWLSRRIGDGRLIALALAAFGVGNLALVTPSLQVVVAASVLNGAAMVWFVVGFTTAMQVHTPTRMQGRVNSASNMFILIPNTVSIALGATLITVFDYRALLAATAVVTLACAVALWRGTSPTGYARPPGHEPHDARPGDDAPPGAARGDELRSAGHLRHGQEEFNEDLRR
ncbi:MFS transporter [Micromonospora inyonensis]|uniref:Predicted arabinose efflux permease, MFS family n=1 Tax=Micromonospora inyonensis TaxID=47866 RepID=A0A1C6S792_9ACTN|nr:MFS transporter [Micromonospora inyonensis]SCL25316.1 Predicted arabinose efflux permease, MFS family [Micromonospora inyonensis]